MAKQLPSWSTLGSFITSLSPFVTSLISFFATSMFISFRSSLSLPTSVLTWRTNIRWWGHRVRITVRFRWFHIRIRWILWIRQMVSLPPLLSVSRRFLVLFCFQFIYFLFVCRKKKRYLKWNLWKKSGTSSNKKGWHRMRGKQERKHSSYTCWISKPRKSNRPTNSHTYRHTLTVEYLPSMNSPQLTIFTVTVGLPSSSPTSSIFFSTLSPCTSFPKTTYFLSYKIHSKHYKTWMQQHIKQRVKRRA